MRNLITLLSLLAARSNDLIPDGALPEGLVKYDDETMDKVSKVGDFLGRLQLMTSNSDKCKSGEFPINHYAYVQGESFTDLGKEVDILVVCMRPCALDTSGDSVVSVHDPEDPVFKDIQDRADNVQNSGCMYGPEFLLYLPKIQKFCSFLMGSKTARRESPKLRAKVRKAATMKSKKIETPKFTWYGPEVNDCVTAFDTPAVDDIVREAEKFNNPPKPNVEVADADETSDNERER